MIPATFKITGVPQMGTSVKPVSLAASRQEIFLDSVSAPCRALAPPMGGLGGLVSDRIRDMNAMVEATRQELEKRYHADTEDLTMRTLKAAQINEDEYFGRILYDELAAILKQIKAAHGNDKTTSDGAAIEQAKKQLENAQKFEGSPLEKKMNVLMGQIGIDYSKLTKEEQMTLLRVFNKSSMLKHRTKAGMRGKHRR